MRSLIRLDKKLDNKVLSSCPDIQNILQSDHIPDLHISVFDHWLSASEAEREVSRTENTHFTDSLHSFCYALFSCHTAYFVKRGGKGKKNIHLKSPTSNDALFQLCKSSHHLISDQHRFVVAIPSLELVYFEGNDYTHHVYYRNESKILVLEKFVKSHSVHILKSSSKK